VQFPGFRLAKVSDYGKEDIEQREAHFKGNPCFAVAAADADADGDGFLDFAFLIVDASKLPCFFLRIGAPGEIRTPGLLVRSRDDDFIGS
jgi:hypothetical protein